MQSATRAYPTIIAGHTIVSVRDLTKGHAYDSSNPPAYMPTLPLSGDDMITFKATNSDPEIEHASSITLTLRASGTEPKVCNTLRRICVSYLAHR